MVIMLFVKLKTFHNNNTKRRMPASASAAKWVNLTAICVFLTVVLPSPANGFTPIGGVFQNGEGRKLFGGYRITPKHCRGTKTLPLSDPRSNGPTICMFNHECAQRNGEVVGACMDGFLFGACCQVPLSNANENTLIKDAQNPFYQTYAHSTEAYDSALYESSQKYESNEFQEIQSSSMKYQEPTATESSYVGELVGQNVHTRPNKTSTNSNNKNKVFYVNKGSVMVSSPSSVSSHDDFVMLSSSTSQSPFSDTNKVSFTTELPMKISTDLVDNEGLTQLPPILAESVPVKRNYSSGSIDLDMGEFTHSDITHPGAESVLIDNDLQFSTGYGGPQSVYVQPPSAQADTTPPKRKPVHGPSKKPSNDQYVLIQTLEASKKPSQTTGTTSTGISTNMDSIESIILMLNGTKHGPSYEVTNTSPLYGQQKPTYEQSPGYGSTASPGGHTYVSVTTVRPIVAVTSGSGSSISSHISTTTHPPSYYADSSTRRPTTTFVQPSTEETSNKYHSVEMSDETPSFVEIGSTPPKIVSDKVDSGTPVGPSLGSYNIMTAQVNYGSNVASHKDPSNPDYGYTSPAQPTSDFNKMPAVGEAYPVMDDETSAYFESSMLSEEEASNQSHQTDEVSDKNVPAYAQVSDQDQSQSAGQTPPGGHKNRPVVQIITQDEVQSQNSPSPQESQGGYYDQNQGNRPQNMDQSIAQDDNVDPIYHKVSPPPTSQQGLSKPSSSHPTPTQVYQQITNNRPSSQPSVQDYDQVTEKRPSTPVPIRQTTPSKHPSTQPPLQDYEPIVQIRPSSQRPPQEYEQIAQTGYISQSTSPHVHIRPTAQILTTSFAVQSPTNQPGAQTTHIIRPTNQVVTHAYEVEDHSSTTRPMQDFNGDEQDEYDQDGPTSQTVTQGNDAAQSSEADKNTYHTPESQLIAQFTNHIQNGYLSNSPTPQIISHEAYNEGYLPRPTPQSTIVHGGPVAQAVNQNNQIQAQAGYFAQPPSFEKIQAPSRPTKVPSRITTLIVKKPFKANPTKPTKVYADETLSTEHPTISSTSRPVVVSTTSRPSKRPTKRVTKRPSTQKKPSTNKVQTAQQPSVPPHKFSGVPPTQVTKRVTTKHPPKKQPPSTSYVTGPTTARPETEATSIYNSPPSPIADKVDSLASPTPSPIYNSIYLASPTDEIILQNAPAVSNHNTYNNNKPQFVKIPSATTKPPSPTVIITPKPTAVYLITKPSSNRPSTTPIPNFAGSNSYIYSPLITRRPEYASSTQEYINIPQVTSNDFDDPGYSSFNTLTTQVLSKIPTDDRPSFPGYYGPTPSYPAFQVPSDKYADVNEAEEETYTSPNDFVNFPPVRNPNLNMSATSSSVTNDMELSTPAFVEDTILKDKMNTLVHKIVESLQDNFEALADMIDDNNNTAAGFSDTTPPATTIVTRRPSTRPPTRRPATRPTSSLRPTRVSTKKPPTRVSTSVPSRRPTVTTRRPVPAVTTRRPTTKKPVTRKPTRRATTTTTTAPPIQEDELIEEEEDVNNNEIDGNIGGDGEAGGRKFHCGVRPHVKSGRIVGGKGSTFGEFPWQVLVRESTWLGLFTKNKCGGVLISNKYVVTAAHCQPGFLASLVAVMGEFDISGDLEAKRSVTKNVKRVIVHRQYDPATFENDLALLELESTVNYDTHIVPICMPTDTADFTGRMATVTGWGRLKYGGGVPSVLQEVQVPIIENSVCQEMFHTAGHNKKILQSFLCAGYANGQKDSCEGDSGGPLVLQRPDGRYELAGTVSHGIKCAAPYLPGVYMRTTFYKPWLRSITGVK